MSYPLQSLSSELRLMSTEEVFEGFIEADKTFDLLNEEYISSKRARTIALVIMGGAVGVLLAAGMSLFGFISAVAIAGCLIAVLKEHNTIRLCAAQIMRCEAIVLLAAEELDRRGARPKDFEGPHYADITKDKVLSAAMHR